MSDDPFTGTDPRTDPASRWYWPDAPVWATFHAGAAGHSGFGWFVTHIVPPEPWPFDTVWPASEYGPPGTVWEFHVSAYADRLHWGAGTWTKAAITHFLRLSKLPELALLPVGSLTWITPGRKPDENMIDVLRATVHAKVGTLEESCNVLHYISDPEVAITPEMVSTFGDKVVTQWLAFLASSTPTGSTVSQLFGGNVHFDEVRAAHVQLVDGKAKWAPGTLTAFKPFPTGTDGSGPALPAQIASTLTLHTGVRAGKKGRSGRGRVYLGPLSVDCLDAAGLFVSGFPQGMSAAFKTKMVTAMDTGPNPFKLVILSGATDARYLVTDVLCGFVPDTQRRRRKSLLEQYVTAP